MTEKAMSALRSDQIERLALMLEHTNRRGGETPFDDEEIVALGVERGWIEITGPSDEPSVPRIRLTDAGRALLLKAREQV